MHGESFIISKLKVNIFTSRKAIFNTLKNQELNLRKVTTSSSTFKYFFTVLWVQFTSRESYYCSMEDKRNLQSHVLQNM